MGLKVNLREKWIRYKAAASAIGGVINEPLAMNSVALENIKSIRSIQLPSGLLTVESFGDYSRQIVEYDTCLRWLILHFCMFFTFSNLLLGQHFASSELCSIMCRKIYYVKIQCKGRLIVKLKCYNLVLNIFLAPSEAQQPQSKKSLPMARLSSKELLALLTKLSTFEYKFHRVSREISISYI